jgi:SAM-dependent methyltransferase
MESVAASYDPLAWVYNRHWGSNADWILRAVKELVLRDLAPPRRVLDLCCGTGQLDRALQDLGYQVTGVDASPEMIRFARANAPACEFLVADVREFSAPEAFDLALCLFDSLNHLMSLEDLRRAFRAVHRVLRVDAPFLFDLNMEEGFRACWRGTFGMVEDDHVCVARSRFLEQDAVGVFLATIFRHESGWIRSDVVLRQKCYAVDDVTRLLSAEGFSNIRVLDAAKDLGLEGQVGRSFFLCAA